LAGLVPIAAYLVFRQVLHSDTYALAISEVIALAWTVAAGRRQRRVNAVVLATAVILAVAFVITLLAGGSALPLKLRRGAITGPLGVACLVSVGMRRPLLPALLEGAARAAPAGMGARLQRVRASLSQDAAMGLTAIVGLTLLGDAAAQVALAFTVSTTTFVAITGLVRLAVAAVGIGAGVVYVRSRRAVAAPVALEADGTAPSLAQRP
jgi:hypothetical protein